MTVVQNLDIGLRVQVAKLQQDLAKAESKFKSFASRATKSLNGIKFGSAQSLIRIFDDIVGSIMKAGMEADSFAEGLTKVTEDLLMIVPGLNQLLKPFKEIEEQLEANTKELEEQFEAQQKLNAEMQKQQALDLVEPFIRGGKNLADLTPENAEFLRRLPGAQGGMSEELRKAFIEILTNSHLDINKIIDDFLLPATADISQGGFGEKFGSEVAKQAALAGLSFNEAKRIMDSRGSLLGETPQQALKAFDMFADALKDGADRVEALAAAAIATEKEFGEMFGEMMEQADEQGKRILREGQGEAKSFESEIEKIPDLPGLLVKGSQDTNSFINNAQRDKQRVELAKQTNKLLAEIKRAIEENQLAEAEV